MNKVIVPSKGITGAVFGGPNLDQIFITAAKYLLGPDGTLLDNRTNDDTLFAINGFGSHGLATPRIRL